MIRLAVPAIALVLATCAAAATPKPNVRGIVVGGAVTVCVPGEPCDPPPKAIFFLVFSRAGHTPIRARIGPTGSFAVYLRPARYAIRLSPAQAGRITPTAVRVPAKGVVRLRLVVR